MDLQTERHYLVIISRYAEEKKVPLGTEKKTWSGVEYDGVAEVQMFLRRCGIC